MVGDGCRPSLAKQPQFTTRIASGISRYAGNVREAVCFSGSSYSIIVEFSDILNSQWDRIGKRRTTLSRLGYPVL